MLKDYTMDKLMDSPYLSQHKLVFLRLMLLYKVYARND